MSVTISTLTCVRCGAELRQRTTRPTRPDLCPICLTDTLIVVSSRTIDDPVQVPDRRDSHG